MDPQMAPTELARYVPGELWLDSLPRRWGDLLLRGFTFPPVRTNISLRAHSLVFYLEGSADIRRRVGTEEQLARLQPGDITLRDARSVCDWEWTEGTLKVFHVYLEPEFLERIARSVHGTEFSALKLRTQLQVRNEELTWLAGGLAREARDARLGSRLVTEALKRQFAVTLLRDHVEIDHRQPRGRLSDDQRAKLADHVVRHLDGDLSVAAMARQLNLGVDHFSRLFRTSFDCSPHRYVMRQRLSLAEELLRDEDLPLAAVAAQAGFADQSHLTRFFKQRHGVSPGLWRQRLAASAH